MFNPRKFGFVLVLLLVLAPALSIPPYPTAPLCADTGEAHDVSLFHTLWDAERGCHYDHEHGQDPFTPDVEAAFPGFDLRQLLGSEIGHTNPSSPAENHHKHGGFKWNVQLEHLDGCMPFEGASVGVNGSAVQYHAFGDYRTELEAEYHSVAALLRQCLPGNPADYGYVFTVQHVTYGQRVVPYQGPMVLQYPNTPDPAYGAGFGPYLSVDCVQAGNLQCRTSLEDVRSRNQNAFSNWTAKRTGSGTRPANSILLNPFFRVPNTYQLLDRSDTEYPYTFLYVCSSDGGATYDPAGCGYNNSRTQLHEMAGQIPPAWDNLAGWDINPAAGRVTINGFVDRFGSRSPACTEAGGECFPFVARDAFTGRWGTRLVAWPVSKTTVNIVPVFPDRNIRFDGQPSGWLGSGN